MSQRLFVAVDPPPDAISDLAQYVKGLNVARARARLAASERWHVTVAFLGDVAVDRLDAVTSALASAAHIWTGGPAARRKSARAASASEPSPAGSAVGWSAASGESAGRVSVGRMSLRIAGGGKFGGRGSTILWAGIDGETERLRRLARAVARELRAARFSLDRKPYRPHLTIARPGARLARDLIAEDVAALAAYQGLDWPVTEFHLVRSHLGPDPHHDRIATFPLP